MRPIILLALLAIACTNASAATKAKPKDYPGPVGLKWGMATEEAKAILNKKFEFVEEEFVEEERTLESTYAGDFAGFETEAVIASFFESKFASLAVSLARPDEVPLVVLWTKVAAAVEKQYGKASKFTTPPKSPASALAAMSGGKRGKAAKEAVDAIESDPTWLDSKIRSGEWQPAAAWRFRNATIFVAVTENMLDDGDRRNFKVMWMFVHNESLRKLNETTKEESDF